MSNRFDCSPDDICGESIKLFAEIRSRNPVSAVSPLSSHRDTALCQFASAKLLHDERLADRVDSSGAKERRGPSTDLFKHLRLVYVS